MENVQMFLAFYLDKLKISNPITYVVLQTLICGTLLLFSTDVININQSVDNTIIIILGGIVAGISPRTSQKAAEYEFPEIDQSNK